MVARKTSQGSFFTQGLRASVCKNGVTFHEWLELGLPFEVYGHSGKQDVRHGASLFLSIGGPFGGVLLIPTIWGLYSGSCFFGNSDMGSQSRA